jgi:hypothetical protein
LKSSISLSLALAWKDTTNLSWRLSVSGIRWWSWRCYGLWKASRQVDYDGFLKADYRKLSRRLGWGLKKEGEKMWARRVIKYKGGNALAIRRHCLLLLHYWGRRSFEWEAGATGTVSFDIMFGSSGPETDSRKTLFPRFPYNLELRGDPKAERWLACSFTTVGENSAKWSWSVRSREILLFAMRDLLRGLIQR